MIVTKIERQKKNPDRYSVFLDGSFAVGVRSPVLLRAGLRKGDDVSPETLDLLRSEEELGAARLAALRYAGRRRRTEQEIRKKLESLAFPPRAIEAAPSAPFREAPDSPTTAPTSGRSSTTRSCAGQPGAG